MTGLESNLLQESKSLTDGDFGSCITPSIEN